MLNDAEEIRTLADYAEEFVLTEDDARTTIQDAEVFIEQMSELLDDSGSNPSEDTRGWALGMIGTC